MYMQVIWVKREEKYFCNQGSPRHNPDTTDLPVGQSHKNHTTKMRGAKHCLPFSPCGRRWRAKRAG